MGSLAIQNLSYDTAIGIGTTTDLSTLADGTTQHTMTGIGRVSNALLIVKNTASANKTITIKAGDSFPSRGLGDMEITAKQNYCYHAVFTGDRFLNSDGTIEFTVESGATGEIRLMGLPD